MSQDQQPDVMVPVPERHVAEVVQFVAHLVHSDLRPWDDDAVEALFLDVDEATKYLLSATARRSVAGASVAVDALVELLEIGGREVMDLVRALNRRAAAEMRLALLTVQVAGEAGPDGRIRDQWVVSMAPEVAAMVRTAEETERATFATAPAARHQATTEAAPTPAPSESSGVEYVFEAYSKRVPPLADYLSGVWDRRRFMFEMARAELRSTYTSTLLGGVWAVIDPLIQAGIYYFLFTVMQGGGRDGTSDAEAATLIIGCVFLFNFTRNVLSDGGRSVVKSRGLMLSSTFPPLLLPLAAFYQALSTFVPCLAVYAVIHVLAGQPIHVGLLYLPVLFALQAALSLGLAFVAATLTVYVHDMLHVVNYLVRILIFVTPVIYPVSLLSPRVYDVLRWNPFFPFFEAYQIVLTGGTPSVSVLLWCTLWAALFLRVGARMFIARERSFALYL